MNIFGKKKVAKPAGQSAADTAKVITELRGKLEMLEKRENHVQRKIDAQIADARARSARKDKRGALMALKRKKLYEKEIQKYNGARLTLEQQIITLEGAAVNKETFNALRSGARAMESIHGDLSAEKVEDIMDDIGDQMQIADDISEAISNPIGGALDDDDELLAELDELDELNMTDQMLSAPTAPASIGATAAPAAPSHVSLPDAPTTTPAVAATGDADADELAALAELEASMMAS